MQNSRLKIPLFFAYDVIHGRRTIFPISLALASSWDLQAIALSGRIAAIEASADGLDMTFAPMVDITRDPSWGRTSEGFGEDPYLVSQIAQTMVKALQGPTPSAADSVMASVKHFALYGAVEGGRDYNVVDMSLMRMYQDYLPPYRTVGQIPTYYNHLRLGRPFVEGHPGNYTSQYFVTLPNALPGISSAIQ